TDGEFLAIRLDDGGFDLGKITIYHFTPKPHFFSAIEIDFVRIGSFQKISEQFDKLLLFGRSSPPPVSTECSLGHLFVIKDWVQNLPQAINPFLLFILRL